ncbi:MAG: flavodoxin family protein [Bacillota bacterium]
MKKILFICGSPRKKSSTEYALREAMKAAEEVGDIETEIVLLRGRKINPCIHCDKCVRENSDRCTVYKDDMVELYDKFYQADGYFIGSPVYDQNLTPQLCAFISRMRPTWSFLKDDHNVMRHKLGAALASAMARNGGQEKTVDAILSFYQTQGITTIGGKAGGYNGAMLHVKWSEDPVATVQEDTEGLEVTRDLAKKLAIMLTEQSK